MRKPVLTVAAALAATSMLATPAFAQEQKKTNTREVLGRVLDAVLGPKPAEQATEEEVETASALASVLADERRADDRARDQYRHPAETLAFFQVEPTHTVAEYAPGGGWYTKVIAPYVADEGKYIGINFGPGGMVPERFNERLLGFPTAFPNQVSEMTGIPAGNVNAYIASEIPEEAYGTADRILLVRMLHNMVRWGVADTELMAMRKLLKDDGMIGVVQHRAPESQPWSMTDGNRGYLKESDVISLMRLYGFELVAKSEINANRNDRADYENGVWTLPPTYARGDENRDYYTAVGESDRMTLLFKKAD